MAVLYRHIRIDKNEPFYIGIGDKENRAYSQRSRNKFWKNIAKQGYEVEILFEDLTWEQACEKEKEFIALYGRRDLKAGTLVNLTDGGEGALGRPMTERLKKVLRDSTSRFSLAKWQRENGAANKGKRIGSKSEKTKEKTSISITQWWSRRSEEDKNKSTATFKLSNPTHIKKQCEHCNKVVGLGGYARWHGSNCKNK